MHEILQSSLLDVNRFRFKEKNQGCFQKNENDSKTTVHGRILAKYSRLWRAGLPLIFNSMSANEFEKKLVVIVLTFPLLAETYDNIGSTPLSAVGRLI